MGDKKHAALGASSSSRWMNCPGSINQSEGKPNYSSEHARLGTAAHDIADRCLTKGVDADTFLFTVQEVEGDYIVIDEEVVEAVQVFIDHVMSRVTEESDELFIENKFDLAPLNPPGHMYGTADAVLWKPSTQHLYVDDYKHGVGVSVDATENTQAMMYALGAVVKLRKKPAKITVSIVQPRGFHPEGTIRSYTFDFDRLKEFKEELFAAAEATTDPDAPLNPGEWCRFCPALATCPAHLANTNALVQAEFAAAEDLVVLTDPQELSIEELTLVLERGSLVQTWLKAVHVHVQGMLERGEDVPGYKLVEGRLGNRRWVDEEEADRYLSRRKLKVGDRYKIRALISPTQAAKILKEKGEMIPDEYISRAPGANKLVATGDKRQALLPATHAFEATGDATDV